MKTVQTQINPESTHHSVKNTGNQSVSFFNTSHEAPFFSPATIQPKLKIGSPDDKYERQADRVADAVVSSPAPDIQQQLGEDEEEMLQMKCSECEKEDELQLKAESGQSGGFVPEAISQEVQNSGGGDPLPAHINSEMSQKMGSDFTGVNIHTGSDAARMNQSLGARAFTHGSDIYFNSGEYNPGTSEGKRLLAHELTHVVQQDVDNLTPQIQNQEFGDNLSFETVPGSRPKVRLNGPYTDETIAEELYGDSSVPIRHDQSDYSIIHIDEIRLLDEWRPFFGEQLQEQDEIFLQYSAEQRAQAGAFALGTALNNSSEIVNVIRNLYNNGVAEIVAERARMLRQVLPSQQANEIINALGSDLNKRQTIQRLSEVLPEAEAARIAERVATMRHQLALNVRAAGGTILRKGAELFDAVRGQGRPTYSSLRADGKTNAQIIASATKTNKLVNKLPSGMRLAGKGFWLTSAGISVYIVLSADPEDQARVAREEVGAFIGGAAGTLALSSICIASGIATGGLGLVACGVVGGIAGGAIGRYPYEFLQLLDIAPHTNSRLTGQMFRLEGNYDASDFLIFSIIHRRVDESEHVLVIATGQVSGSLTSGRGHYRSYEVIPANSAAEELFGDFDPQWIPYYILHPVTEQDLLNSEGNESSPVPVQRKEKTASAKNLADRKADTNVQRKCSECEKEDKLLMKSDSSKSSGYFSPEISRQVRNSRNGNRLSSSINREMSQKIGVDFSDVNIHTGSEASRMNQSLGARAFTHGNNIYFNSGEYNPETSTGKHLLAHELTHVVQQKKNPLIQKQEAEIPSPDAEDGSFEFDYDLLPPGLRFTIGNWMLEANTGSAELQFTQGLFEYSFGYSYGSQLFAGVNRPGFNTRLGINPASGETSLGFTIMDQFRLRGTLNPMERSGGVSLGYGASLLPMPLDLHDPVLGGWAGASSILGNLGSMQDPISFYQSHSNDVNAVMSAVRALQPLADEDRANFGAGLRFTYNPDSGALIYGGMQWFF